MTKSEFVDHVPTRGSGKKQAAESRPRRRVLATIEDALKRGSEVTFTGFGKFSVADRGARQGVHPQTKQPIHIPASRVPRFSAGSGLKSAVKGS